MKKFLAALLIVVMLFTVSIPRQNANAEALLISQIAGAAYAVAASAGIDLTFTNGSAGGSQAYIENLISSWVLNQNGGLAVFGSQPIRVITGLSSAVLSVSQTAYNAIKNFWNDYITEYSLSDVSTRVYDGEALGTPLLDWSTSWNNVQAEDRTESTPFWAYWESDTTPEANGFYRRVTFRGGVGTQGNAQLNTTGYKKPEAWRINYNSNTGKWWIIIRYSYYYSDPNSVTTNYVNFDFTVTGLTPENQINATIPANGPTYQVLQNNDIPTYRRNDWTADTNLEQMLEDIFEDTADNNLDLTEETVQDIPAEPEPTTAPTDIPGQLDGIQEGITDIAGTLEGVGEAVGTISEALEGVGEGVGTITEALSVPTASEANSLKLPDLRTLFPFCIPFDIYNIITAFNASPAAPHVQIPFNIPAVGLTYTFDLDFASFNSVAAVLRTLEFVAYAIGLAILTSKVIRW